MNMNKDQKNSSALALISAIFPPGRGGMGTVAAEEARALAKLGPVCVYTLRSGLSKNRNVIGGDFDLVRLRGWPQISYGGFVPHLLWYLRHHKIVYAELPAYGFLLPLLIWKIIWRGRLVVTVHMDPIGTGWRRAAFWLERFLLKRLIKSADLVRVSNAAFLTSKIIIDSGCDLAKVKVIPFGVDLKKFHPLAAAADSSPTFLFVGRLARTHYFKGVDLLLRAFQSVQNQHKAARLLIVGDGDLRAQYETRSRDLGIASQVEFLGAVADQDLPAVYRRAQALVLPSIDSSETFGLVLLEAMASGVPVIASRLPGVDSLLVAGQVGELVEPGNVAELKQAMESVVSNPALWQSYTQAARQHAEQYGDWDNIARQLTELLY